MTGDNLTALKHLQTDADRFDAAEGKIYYQCWSNIFWCSQYWMTIFG